jgi:amino acid adenylation domain-containing protein
MTQYTIPESIMRKAAEYPLRQAVVTAESTLSYRELALLSADLCDQLRRLGVGPGTSIATSIGRGPALAVALLGTWLAECVYVPIDLSGPSERRDHILADSDAQIILSDGSDAAARSSCQVLPVRAGAELAASYLQRELGEFVNKYRCSPDDLAYVAYTSGSTGMPKGVQVEHGSMSAMAAAHEAVIYTATRDPISRVAWNNIPAADAFFSDYVNLAFGRTLHVVPDNVRSDSDALGRYLASSAVQVLDATPTQIRTMLAAGHAAALASLQMLVVGGEAIDEDLWHALHDLADVLVLNMYGPTECTVDVTAAVVKDYPAPVIGSPLPGNAVFILDDDLQPVADGAVGEVCVAGRQVARGYSSAGKADRERFTAFTPPGARKPVRMYRTGDLGRWNPAGVLEYLGRADSQVKINGYRIEPGEVRAALLACPGTEDAYVAVRQCGGEATLIAWVVPKDRATVSEIRDQVMAKIPAYMRPLLVAMPQVPLTAAGSVDTRALPDPTETSDGAPSDDKGTGDENSSRLRGLWRDVLGVGTVTDEDDFFALGGDSEKATRLTVCVRKSVMQGVPIRLIFEYSEFRTYCAAIRTLAVQAGGDAS